MSKLVLQQIQTLEMADLFLKERNLQSNPFKKAHYPLTLSQLDKNTSSNLTNTHVSNLQKDSWFQN